MLSSLYCLPQLGDILVVFVETTGKTMVAITVADKVEIVRLRRMQGCFERAAAGVPDRPGRKSGMGVGVVSGLELHVGMLQCSHIIPIEQCGIDRARIGLQSNVSSQPVVVTAGHDGPLLRNPSPFLDNN